MGDMTVCDKVCLIQRGLRASFLKRNKSSLVDETPGKGFMTSEFSLEDASLGS